MTVRLIRTLLSALLLCKAVSCFGHEADSILKVFDDRPTVSTANQFFAILDKEDLMDEPIRLTRTVHPDTMRQQVWYWATEFYHVHQDYSRAIAYGLKALPLCHAGENRVIEGDCLSVLAVCYIRLGDFKNAAIYARQCNEIDVKGGNPDNISSSLNLLAGIYMSAHLPKEAEEYILKGIEYSREADNPARMAVLLGMASEVYKSLHNDTLALDYATQAYQLEKKLNRRDKAAMRQDQMASALIGLHRTAEARKILGEAIPVLRESKNDHSLAIACNHMGQVLIQQGHLQEAVDYLNEALPIFVRQGDIFNEATCQRALYQALHETNPKEAIQHNDRFNELRDSLYDKETSALLAEYAAQFGNDQLQAENEQLQRKHTHHYLLGTGIFALLALLTWLYIKQWQKREQRHIANLMATIEELNSHLSIQHKAESVQALPVIKPQSGEEEHEFIILFNNTVEKLMKDHDCSVERVAAALNMSSSSLRRRVQEATGETPKALISAIQMQKASLLIHEHPEMPISDVAYNCGFEEHTNFTRAFKRTFGITPSQYAKNTSK